MTRTTRRVRPCARHLMADERGAVLIQVGVALVALLGFSAFAVDYGVVWVAREQAQNAADTAALAAATTLAFDDMFRTTAAADAARSFAGEIPVWGQPGATEVTVCTNSSDATCPRADGLPTPQVRSAFGATVSVYRDDTHNNALPTYFAALFGVTSQGVRAQASATAAPSNVATCVWPLAIPDNWTSRQPPEPSLPDPFAALCNDPSDPRCKPFAKYLYPGGPPALLNPPVDSYTKPALSSSDPTPTGYTLALAEPMAPTGLPSASLNPQRFVDVLKPDPATGLWQPARRSAFAAVKIGTGDFYGSLTTCNDYPVHVGDILPLEPVPPPWSSVTGGASQLIGGDSAASWDDASFRIRGSCTATGACGAVSPRLVLVPMFDPDRYDETRGGLPEIRVVNFIGMFIDSSTNSTQVVGHLTIYPAKEVDLTGCAQTCVHPFVGYKWAFLRTAILTR